MRTYTFTLILEGPELTGEDLSALHQGGCDDAAFGRRGSEQIADFDRAAPTLAGALLNAIWDVESGVPTLQVVRVEPDDLVNATTIAERTGRTRESIRLLVAGERGLGNFPRPLTWLDGTSKVWHWGEVVDWFAQHVGENVSTFAGAPQFVAALNGVLETRKQFAALSALAADQDSTKPLAFTEESVRALPAMLEGTVEDVRKHLNRA